MKPLEDCFLIVCRGVHEECESVWLVPISELKDVMKMSGIKTFKELADSFVCPRCQDRMNMVIASLEALNQLSLPE